MSTSTFAPNARPAFVGVSPDGSGKKVANYAVQMYVDDGSGPVLQTVYFQAVNVNLLDENGNIKSSDDNIDYEWKRQLLDEMRAIRIGIEHLMETSTPSFDATKFSLIEEARAQRIDQTSNLYDSLQQEG